MFFAPTFFIMPLRDALQRLQSEFGSGGKDARPAPRTRYVAPDALYFAGLETVTPTSGYHWDGEKRDVWPPTGFVVFQVTLAGSGLYEDAARGGAYALGPGDAFAAVVPSAHRYYLPPASASWTFFWVMIPHPYIAGRIASRVAEAGAVWSLHARPETGEALLSRAARLLRGPFADAWATEQALFDFLIALERFAHALTHTSDETGERDRLENAARRFVLENLAASFGVADLARADGLTRSHYSHRFKAATGTTPARFIARVRLEETARRLIESADTLAVIARETGFADANHLCKTFRRYYHLSPGAFRRQLRGG